MYQAQFSQGKFISRNLHSKNKIFITILIYKTILFVLFIHASQLFIRFSRSGLGKCRLYSTTLCKKYANNRKKNIQMKYTDRKDSTRSRNETEEIRNNVDRYNERNCGFCEHINACNDVTKDRIDSGRERENRPTLDPDNIRVKDDSFCKIRLSDLHPPRSVKKA